MPWSSLRRCQTASRRWLASEVSPCQVCRAQEPVIFGGTIGVYCVLRSESACSLAGGDTMHEDILKAARSSASRLLEPSLRVRRCCCWTRPPPVSVQYTLWYRLLCCLCVAARLVDASASLAFCRMHYVDEARLVPAA
jgi:hypothetical protein